MGRKKVLEDELNDLEGKLQRAEKLVTGECTATVAEASSACSRGLYEEIYIAWSSEPDPG